jgi:hypothetical protein
VPGRHRSLAVITGWSLQRCACGLQLSSEWLPTSTVVYQPPNQRVGDLVRYKNQKAIGPREAMEAAQLLAKAHTLVPQKQHLCRQLSTTYRTEFIEHDTSGLVYAAPPVLSVLPQSEDT